MSTTGPMDPERLASVSNTIGGYEKKHVAPFLVELLAAHDHLALQVTALEAESNHIGRLLADSLCRVMDLEAEVASLEADARGTL